MTNLTVNPSVFNPSNGQRATISFYINHSAKSLTQILNGTTVVKTLNDSRSAYQTSGNYSYTWDGRDNNGNLVSDGNYQVRVMADDGNNTDTDRANVQVGNGTIGIGQRCAGFTDVSIDSPFCKAITLMSQKDIFQGYPDGTFRPNQRINRAETAKVMVLALGYSVPTANFFGNLYNDTASNAWYSPFLQAAKTNAIATGYPDGSFRPANTINRVELLRVFLEANHLALDSCDPQPYEDTPITSDTKWYMKYACYAKHNDLMGTNGSNKLFPAEDMTRGDVANLFYDFQVKGLYTNVNSVFYTGNNNNSCYTNSNGIYTCNNLVNNTNSNSCYYNNAGVYTCNNSLNSTCIYNTNGTTSNCSTNNNNCYYNANGTVNCNNNSTITCSQYDYACLNSRNTTGNTYYNGSNGNYGNSSGYYVYQNGQYVWVTY